MKRTLLAIVSTALVAVGVMTAAAMDDGEEKMTVFTMSDKEETCILVAPGSMFALRFQGRPGTGYAWAFGCEPDKRLLEFLGETVEERNDGILGGNETFVWTFRALAAGEAKIAMTYSRPWEADVPPQKVHVFNVKIQLPPQEKADGQVR